MWWAALAAGWAAQVPATEVNVTALFKDKAMVSVNGGSPQLLSTGQRAAGGVRLVRADSAAAVLEVNGRRLTLGLGQGISASYAPADRPRVTLTADGRGHFVRQGSLNGAAVTFLVDTGATTIALGTAQARALGIAFGHGERGLANTANGAVAAHRMVFDRVRLGDISLDNVEGAVIESELPYALLGMSFLKRLEMQRSGNTLTLTKAY